MNLRGFVAAGGRSSRMGRDKSLLPYRASTLLEHAIAKLRGVTPDVRILCGPARRYEDFGVPVVEDAICGVGPVGGLYSALLSASVDRRDKILWLAVDVPLVPPSLLTRLVDGLDDADIVMARTTDGLESVCAAFRTGPTLEAVRSALLAGRLKVTAALEGLNLLAIDADPALFANINSPSEYERLAKA